MSYLNPLRLHFAGKFQANVSTVNNDPKNFDITNFKPEFQNLGVNQAGWNPVGDGSWRLIGCKVTSAFMPDGIGTDDPVLNYWVADSDSRVSAKLVDLDPENQGVSMIFGLQVRLSDSMGSNFLRGQFDPAPFTDIWIRAISGVGFGAAGATYQSVLTDLEWGEVAHSPFLSELQRLSSEGLLSIKFNVDQYVGNYRSPDFTYGRVVGTIGPASCKEPRHFVLGRQLTGQDMPTPGPFFKPRNLVNFCVASVDPERGKVLLDLGNALPTHAGPQAGPDAENFVDLGPLVLKCAEVNLGTIDPLDYAQDANWYGITAGIVEMPCDRSLSAEEVETIINNPLSLIGPGLSVDGSQTPAAVTENPTGEHVRADKFVFRMNPGAGETDNKVTASIYATKWGLPLAGEAVTINYVTGGTNATIPPALSFPTATDPTDATGKTCFEITASDPRKQRQYLDGQVYWLAIALHGGTNAPPNPADEISLLVWTAFKPDNPVTWYGSIQPIFQLYENLYPVMKRFISLGNYDQVCANVRLLSFAFGLDPSNPNYMPVTRDLSEAKRKAILAWLNSPVDGKPLLGTPPTAAATLERAPLSSTETKEILDRQSFYLRHAKARNTRRK
jgi:hypothetical protein